jgi:uncharacterized membrane-anchored protein
MIAEREITRIKPVEERPAITVSLPQPKWSDKLFIASNICLLAGLLVMAIALMLPANVTLSLFLLIAEVSLFVVGAELFALGFVWPRIK